MRLSRLLAVLLFLGWSAISARADEPAEADHTYEIQVVFANSSTVRLQLLQDQIEVTTRFGALSIPLKEVQRIEFGARLPALLEKKVDLAIRKLASTLYSERDQGERDLLSVGPQAYATLLKASKSSDMEVARRSGKVIATLREKYAEKDLRSREDDIIYTPGFVILGRITTPALKTRSEYFGDVPLSLVQLRHLKSLRNSSEIEITLDASRNGSAHGQWLDTGFQVEGTLLISATGSVDIYPQTPGQYMSTPAGYQGPGMPARSPLRGVVTASAIRNYPGTLIGRIGEDGELFVVGERYEGAVSQEGRLFLHVVPSPWNNASSGNYQIRIGSR